MTQDAAAEPVTVSIAWRAWSATQDPSKPKLDAKSLSGLTEDDAAELKAFGGQKSMMSTTPVKATGAVAVQLWVDVPRQTARSDARVGAALQSATEKLCELVCDRDPKLADVLAVQVEGWACAVRRTAAADGTGSDADGAGAAEAAMTVGDRDLFVRTFSERVGAAVVGIDRRLRRTSGDWEDLGASLMIAVGPDRYGIRVRAPGASGHVPFPNHPFEVKTTLLLSALEAEVEQLATDLGSFERRVTDALTSTSERDVRAFLGEAQTLLKRRAALEQRSRAFRQACTTLSSGWRANSFKLPDDHGEPLRRIDARLAQLRSELVDIPQLLLAAGSWRQASNTETLSLVAAGLVPPTLIAGALGANILPWSDPTDGAALVGMLLLMAASAAGAILLVRWRVFDAARQDSKLDVRRAAAALLVCVALAVGVYLLLDGTTVRQDAAAGRPGDALREG